MKTLNYVALAFAVIGVLGCGGSNGSGEFHSPDLSSFFLQGPVKTVDNGTKVTFDEQGPVIEAEAEYTDPGEEPLVFRVEYDPSGNVVGGCSVERDDQGRLHWLGVSDGCSGEQGYHFEYENVEDGIMRYWYDMGYCTGTEYRVVTKADELGNPLQERTTAGDEVGECASVIDYEYLTFDSHGNWTERKAKVESTVTTYVFDWETGEDGEDEVEVSTEERTERRTISYYE